MLRIVAGLILLLSWAGARGAEFTVLTYNVENLFDLDGQSAFDDYRQGPEGPNGGWSATRLLTKLEGIGQVLRRINDGAGPEIIVFQEFERDHTPATTLTDLDAFLRQSENLTVREMLTTKYAPGYGGLPSEVWLLKHLRDLGMRDYSLAQPPATALDAVKPPHKCVVFSKFPIAQVRAWPLEEARDILEVHLTIEDQPLVILNNHWKSGASSTDSEPIRRQNARALRARVEELLRENPAAPVLLAGDFNSHYNQTQVLSRIAGQPVESGLNDILGSRGDESALRQGSGLRLYNLWWELPNEARGSEAYRGYRSTLMQMILTPGLSDGAGVDYVDGSFFVAAFPGLNADTRWGRPVAWRNYGDGFGFSDHFPVGARFQTLPVTRASPEPLVNPSREPETPPPSPKIPYAGLSERTVDSARLLKNLSDRDLARHFGEPFFYKGRLESVSPPAVRIGDRRFDLWTPSGKLLEHLRQIPENARVRFIGELDEHQGRLQFVIQDPTWWEP